MNDAEYRTRLGHGFVLGVSLPVLLGAAGLAVAGNTAGGIGWDQLASALGGLLIGGLSGFVLAVVIARRAELPLLRTVAIIAGAGATALVGFVAWRLSA